jgi:hypothetical protein
MEVDSGNRKRKAVDQEDEDAPGAKRARPVMLSVQAIGAPGGAFYKKGIAALLADRPAHIAEEDIYAAVVQRDIVAVNGRLRASALRAAATQPIGGATGSARAFASVLWIALRLAGQRQACFERCRDPAFAALEPIRDRQDVGNSMATWLDAQDAGAGVPPDYQYTRGVYGLSLVIDMLARIGAGGAAAATKPDEEEAAAFARQWVHPLYLVDLDTLLDASGTEPMALLRASHIATIVYAHGDALIVGDALAEQSVTPRAIERLLESDYPRLALVAVKSPAEWLVCGLGTFARPLAVDVDVAVEEPPPPPVAERSVRQRREQTAIDKQVHTFRKAVKADVRRDWPWDRFMAWIHEHYSEAQRQPEPFESRLDRVFASRLPVFGTEEHHQTFLNVFPMAADLMAYEDECDLDPMRLAFGRPVMDAAIDRTVLPGAAEEAKRITAILEPALQLERLSNYYAYYKRWIRVLFARAVQRTLAETFPALLDDGAEEEGTFYRRLLFACNVIILECMRRTSLTSVYLADLSRLSRVTDRRALHQASRAILEFDNHTGAWCVAGTGQLVTMGLLEQFLYASHSLVLVLTDVPPPATDDADMKIPRAAAAAAADPSPLSMYVVGPITRGQLVVYAHAAFAVAAGTDARGKNAIFDALPLPLPATLTRDRLCKHLSKRDSAVLDRRLETMEGADCYIDIELAAESEQGQRPLDVIPLREETRDAVRAMFAFPTRLGDRPRMHAQTEAEYDAFVRAVAANMVVSWLHAGSAQAYWIRDWQSFQQNWNAIGVADAVSADKVPSVMHALLAACMDNDVERDMGAALSLLSPDPDTDWRFATEEERSMDVRVQSPGFKRAVDGVFDVLVRRNPLLEVATFVAPSTLVFCGLHTQGSLLQLELSVEREDADDTD